MSAVFQKANKVDFHRIAVLLRAMRWSVSQYEPLFEKIHLTGQ
jgi:hypothetical protein